MNIVEFPNLTPAPSPTIEPWVDLATVAKHIGFGYDTTSKMVKSGIIPHRAVKNGSKTFYRFKLSEVDAAFALQEGNSLHTRQA